jgi:hypothetical protein
MIIIVQTLQTYTAEKAFIAAIVSFIAAIVSERPGASLTIAARYSFLIGMGGLTNLIPSFIMA